MPMLKIDATEEIMDGIPERNLLLSVIALAINDADYKSNLEAFRAHKRNRPPATGKNQRQTRFFYDAIEKKNIQNNAISAWQFLHGKRLDYFCDSLSLSSHDCRVNLTINYPWAKILFSENGGNALIQLNFKIRPSYAINSISNKIRTRRSR